MERASFNLAVVVCIFVYLGFLTPALAAPGATPGDGDVTATGAATYSIPIRIPEGVNGLQPSVALAYHSRAGNGLAGVGWNVTGVSEIRRCGQIFAIDGKQTGVALNTNDRFCLDGERLVRGTGTYGANGATYYTEIESYAKVTSYTSGGGGSLPGNGPQWFKVETPDGLIYEYGKTADSRLEPAGSNVPLAWSVSRITDPNGNYIDFSYLEEKGAQYPREIRYTGTAVAAPIYSIFFNYELKPSAERVTQYVAGGSQRYEKRLESIELQHGGSTFREYELIYEAAMSPTGLSRLTSIRECAGSDCLSPTTIDWHELESGLPVSASESVSTSLGNAHVMDVDGDGRKDLVYPGGSSSSSTWRIRFATALPGNEIAFGDEVNTGRSASAYATAIPMDFNGDGRMDIAYLESSTWRILESTGTGFKAAINTGVVTNYYNNNLWIADINGDGRDDVIYARDVINAVPLPGNCEPGVPCYRNEGYVEIFYRLNTGASLGAEVLAVKMDNLSIRNIEFPTWHRYKSTSTTPDFNGDGISDLMVLVSPVPQPICSNCGDPQFWQWRAFEVKTGSFSPLSGVSSIPYGASPLILDANGDGLSDLAYADTGINKWVLHLSNGKGVNAPITTTLARNAYTDKAVVVDYNGDGRDDIVLPDAGQWKVARSTGAGFQALQSLVSWQVDQFARVGDFDGDGDGDLLFLKRSGTTLYWQRGRNKRVFGDLVAGVTDGLTNKVTFSYGSSADSEIHAAYAHSKSDAYGRMWIPYGLVSKVERSDGNGGLYALNYFYERGRRDLQGRGFLGFEVRNVIDTRDLSRIAFNYYNHFPFRGLLKSRYMYQQRVPKSSTQAFLGDAFDVDLEYDGTHPECDAEAGDIAPAYAATPEEGHQHIVTMSWAEEPSPYSTKGIRLLLETSRERRYYTPGKQHYDFITRYSGYDAWGNATTIRKERTVEPQNFPSVTISNTYSNSISARRCPGRLTSSTTTYSAPGMPNVIETEAQGWDAAKCRVAWQEREPGSATHRVRTSYGYDVFGNIDNVTASGAGVNARSASISYDALGYRKIATVNPLGHTATMSWDPSLRQVVAATDLDGNLTSFQYDNFDRTTRITRPDGSYTTFALANCTSDCGGGKLLFDEVHYADDGAQGGQRKTWLDGLGRARRTEQRLFGGVWTSQRIDYDSFGHVAAQSMPYKGSQPGHFVHYRRDQYGRPVEVELPGEGNEPPRTVQYLYSRASATTHEHYVRVTDADGRATTHYFDTLGRPSRARDAAGEELTFQYDAAGRLISTVDPEGNATVIAYDALGHRASLADPALGAWSFTYNVFGELVSQTDARNQTIAFSYDALGRLTQRSAPDGVANWMYDTAAGAGTGKLHKITAPGYEEILSYDALGRPITRQYEFDSSTYTYDFSYDAFSRLERITYPVSVLTANGNRFAVSYAYDNAGTLERVSNANNASETFWEAADVDVFGNYALVDLGNGVRLNRVIDPATGRLKEITADIAGTPLWNINYGYSAGGDILHRADELNNRREDFTYDSLHRLDTYSLNGVVKQDIDYDALGNITNKTGIGSYSYSSARPHAVTATGNGVNYQYDANGNMTQRGATSIAWNSTNLPTQIQSGSATLNFHYGPQGARYKQTAAINGQSVITHYIGGLMEAVGGNGVIQYRHKIVAAGEVIAQHTRDNNVSGGNPRTIYFSRDMLGSIGMITDDNANVVGQMHFDPWGQRLDAADWDGAEQSADIDALRDLTHRGFTDHEMLDAANLIHMNGRIYDPGLGRMLSADPVNSEPGNLQRYNRYSYVNNNPLGFTDPSGLDRIGTPVRVYWICRDACDSHSKENRERGWWNATDVTTDDMVPGYESWVDPDGLVAVPRPAASSPLPIGEMNGLPAGGFNNVISPIRGPARNQNLYNSRAQGSIVSEPTGNDANRASRIARAGPISEDSLKDDESSWLDSLRELIGDHSAITLNVTGGFILVSSLSVTVTSDNIAVYLGGGLGGGLSATATAGAITAVVAQDAITTQATFQGGFGGAGHATIGFTPTGASAHAGVGTGGGMSVAATAGYTWNFKW